MKTNESARRGQGYEAPKTEVIAIVSQSVLCGSGDSSTGITGRGFQFNHSTGGQW